LLVSDDRFPSEGSADPIRNFTIGVEERIRALTIGVPAWSARKRRIEDQEEARVVELVELHGALVAKGKAPEVVERALVAAAAKLDLRALNTLVATHNRYYPIEANLPMDRNRNYVAYGRPWKPEEPFTAERLLAAAQERLKKND
jgi:hypothetical protein